MTIAWSIIGRISTIDRSLMRRVNWWPAPRWIRVWMICATRGGDGWLWYVMGLAVLLFGGASRWEAAASAAISTGAGLVLFLSLKRMIRRPRPCAVEAHCWARLLPPDQFAFPSGHSITAFAVAVPLGVFYPALMPGMLFCAVSVALTRVLLGMHHLSDVIAGSLAGTILGIAACAVFL